MTDKRIQAELAASMLPSIFAQIDWTDEAPTYTCPLTRIHFMVLPRLCEDIDGPEELRYRLEVTPRHARMIAYNTRDDHHSATIIAGEIAASLLAPRGTTPPGETPVQRPHTPFCLQPFELHGLVVKAVHVTETDDVTIDFVDRSHGYFQLRMDGTRKLVTPRSELDQLVGERFDEFLVKVDRLTDGADTSEGTHALFVTITTTDEAPSVTLTWHLIPAPSDHVDPGLMYIHMDPRPDEVIQ